MENMWEPFTYNINNILNNIDQRSHSLSFQIVLLIGFIYVLTATLISLFIDYFNRKILISKITFQSHDTDFVIFFHILFDNHTLIFSCLVINMCYICNTSCICTKFLRYGIHICNILELWNMRWNY